MRRWLIRVLLTGLIVGAICLVFRQGLLPAHLTPLPRLDLAHPMPLVVDWQIAELRYDRRLCREMIATPGVIKARQIPDRIRKNGCGWVNAVRMSEAGGASIGVSRVSCQWRRLSRYGCSMSCSRKPSASSANALPVSLIGHVFMPQHCWQQLLAGPAQRTRNGQRD